MSKVLDHAYLDDWSKKVTATIGEGYFNTKKYMSGQEIIRLTTCTQLNLMVIKILFEAWQKEIEELSHNPYFDYGDYAVKEALKEFMEVLSRAIKIKRTDFDPLLESALFSTVQLAVDPLTYFEKELGKADSQPKQFFRDFKKYIKWHQTFWHPVFSQIEGSSSMAQLQKELHRRFADEGVHLEDPSELLRPLEQIQPLDWEKLVLAEPQAIIQEEVPEEEEASSQEEDSDPNKKIIKEREKPASNGPVKAGLDSEDRAIDPALTWARFESEEYSFMKGSVKNLQEDLGINQRYMFTKNLFEGNPDLMNQALQELDASDSFYDAVNLLNENFVHTLNWDVHSEEVEELLQLIFRKFEDQ